MLHALSGQSRFNLRLMALIVGFTASAFSFVTPAFAENWPCWRGPRGDGTSQEETTPTSWNGLTGDKHCLEDAHSRPWSLLSNRLE